MTELRYRNEYLEKKMVHCLETMMERGVNFEWPPRNLESRGGDNLKDNLDEKEDVEFGRDFQATKVYIERSAETEGEKLKVYLNKVLRRCEKLESRCHFLQDLQEQTKVLSQQPTANPLSFRGLTEDISSDNMATFEANGGVYRLQEGLKKANHLIKELQNANERVKLELMEEQNKREILDKEAIEIRKIYEKNEDKKVTVIQEFNIIHYRISKQKRL